MQLHALCVDLHSIMHYNIIMHDLRLARIMIICDGKVNVTISGHLTCLIITVENVLFLNNGSVYIVSHLILHV